MTEYGQTRQKPAPILFNDHVQERKAEHRKIIDDVMERRRRIYSRYMDKKRRLQGSSDVGTMT